MKKQLPSLILPSAILLFAIVGGLTSVYAQIPTNGLVAWYPFQGNVLDSSGNGHNGTNNGATLTTDRFGNGNSAYYFNGTSASINTNYNINMANVSLVAWIKTNVSALNMGIVSARVVVNDSLIGISLNYSNAVFDILDIYTEDFSQGITLDDNNWHLIIGTYDGTSSKMYVDGVLNNVENYSVTLTDDAYYIIGWDDIATTRHFNGSIDGVCIYNRAITASEVKQIYQEGISIPTITNKTACFGSTIPSLTATGTNINWYSDANLSNLLDSGSTYNTGRTAVGTYIYYVTQTVIGIQGPATIDTLTIYAMPSQSTTPSGTSTLCINSANTDYYTSSTINATTYQWDISPAGAGTITGTDTTGTVAWNNSFTGTAKIFVNGINGGLCNGAVSDTLVVTVNPLPGVATTPTGASILCQNSPDTSYTTTGATNAASYQWFVSPSNAGVMTGTGTTSTMSWDTAFYGNAYISVKGINGVCDGTVSDSIEVTILQAPTATITPAGANSICQGDTVTLNSNSCSGCAYLWSTTATTQSINVNTSGNYSVKVTNSSSCSATSSSTTVTVNQNPPVPTIQENGNVLMSSSSTGNQWNLNGDTISGATSQYYTATASGFYTVTVTNAQGCSSASAAASVTTVSIAELINESSFSLYPSPATNQLTIHTSSFHNEAVTVTIMNMLVETLQQEKLTWSSDISININNLAAGMYFLQMKTVSGSVVKRFVKE